VSAGDLVGFGPRFAAYLIDAAAVGIGGLILAAILNHVAQGLGLVVLLAGIGYFPYFWSTSGQTLGMQVMHIKVVRLDRQPLSAGTGIVRYLGYVLSVMALYLGLLWVLWDPQKQGWHDKMAGTVVVRAN
jgi:uncharacterized RDD family membrane protein YckC